MLTVRKLLQSMSLFVDLLFLFNLFIKNSFEPQNNIHWCIMKLMILDNGYTLKRKFIKIQLLLTTIVMVIYWDVKDVN